MHRDHDHDHHHHAHHHHEHASANGARAGVHAASLAGPGHNHPHAARDVAQWQTPHREPHQHAGRADTQGEPDLDQVEAAFVEGFLSASNPMGFLRLANVPFEMTDQDTRLVLLRVETDVIADVGSITPHLGGRTFRYDPLPASLISQRRRLRFIYFDGAAPRALSYAQVRSNAAPGDFTAID
jgi:hypothetical protein